MIEDIKKLQGYDGYIQFSDKKIRSCDIFKDDDIAMKIDPTAGFIYEAHFCNGVESIQIRQVNDRWLVSTTDLTNKEFDISYEEYISDIENFPYKVKMAQIWETQEDPLCEGMQVKKLTKVVFVGFEKGERK